MGSCASWGCFVTAPRIVEEDWRDRAACKGEPGFVFFPEQVGGPRPKGKPVDDYANARLICGRCPVQTDCLNHALDNREVDGFWGGATPRQRRTIRTTRRLNHSLPVPSSELGAWRHRMGYTLAYVGMLTGVSAQAVSKWETGRVPIPDRVAKMIEGSR